ncbi:hypothetical protein P3S68_027836 [Capsicum galapagoense]
MLLLRVTPILPNILINIASLIIDVPHHIFFLGTVVGIIPATYVTVQVIPRRHESHKHRHCWHIVENSDIEARQQDGKTKLQIIRLHLDMD